MNKKSVDLSINSALLDNLECVFVYPNALAPHRIKGVFDT